VVLEHTERGRNVVGRRQRIWIPPRVADDGRKRRRPAWVMLVLVVPVLAGAATAIVMAIHRSSVATAPSSVPPESNARRLLDERFWRGEIDEDEYRRRRSLLAR
jgi:putative membrane protein